MEVIEVSGEEYDNLLKITNHVFNSAKFAELNKEKCERVIYLVFKDTKVRLGIILGLRDNVLYSPFSAPFGGFRYSVSDITIKHIDDSIFAIENWAVKNNFKKIQIINPPMFIDANFISKAQNSFYRHNYINNVLDVNYHFDLTKMNDKYIDNLKHSVKKNLKRGLKSELSFSKLTSEEGERSYNVIVKNRSLRGFPLRMTWKQLKDTTSLINCDFFVVTKDDLDIAAAIVFHISDSVVQVIYWGDLPEYSENKSMNYLSYNVFLFYKKSEIKIVDIGPSTENSIPNNGLCEFKEGIGCDLSLKSTFVKSLNCQ